MLWQRCNLSLETEGDRKPSLTPEKQMMRLRMLAPLIAVNSSQVWTDARVNKGYLESCRVIWGYCIYLPSVSPAAIRHRAVIDRRGC